MVLAWFAFFFIGMAPGFWFPALTNILAERGLGAWVPAAFLCAPIAALLSPLIGGAMADHRFRAEQLLGWITLGGSVFVWLAFLALERGWSPWWFIIMLLFSAIASAPMWGLLSSIALAHLPCPERQFPVVRLGGTLGWLAAGVIVSYALQADTSPRVGYATVVARVLAAGVAFLLPPTPPRGGGGDWRRLLGLDALTILRQRDHFVFFLTTGLFSVPLAAFYMYAPAHLRALGDLRSTATMTLGQWVEIVALLAIGWVMLRCRIKTVLLWALGLAAARYGLFMLAGVTGVRWWLVPGVALHGLCYTFYFITAQIFIDRRVEPGLRGQAQGLITLVSGGLGSLIGTLTVGQLFQVTVAAGHGGWTGFWGVLTAAVLACMVIFAVFYQGQGMRPVAPVPGPPQIPPPSGPDEPGR
jgi:nucleoside transporter